MDLLLKFKVSDGKNSKIELINLSLYKMQFLSHCYNAQAKIGKDDS